MVNLEVETADGENVTCRCYKLHDTPEAQPGETLAEHRKPSPLYWGIVIDGAVESGLPEDYVAHLRKIKPNGNSEAKLQKIMMRED